jgi:hypothetical protein
LSVRTLSRAAGAFSLLIALSAAPGGAQAATKRKPSKTIAASKAFTLPAAKTCVARRTLTIKLLKPRGVTWTRVTVDVGRKRVKTFTRPKRGASLKVTGLPASGRYTVAIAATAARGRKASASRTYRACAAAAKLPAPTVAPPAPAAPAPVAPAPPAPPVLVTPVSGAYTGTGVSLYVSADAKQVQDVAAASVAVSCGDGTGATEQVVADEIGVAADGSFSSKVTHEGLLDGVPVTFTATFKGRFANPTSAAGTVRLDAVGGGTTCTSGDKPWSAARAAQPTPQPTTAPPPGGYEGSNGQNATSLALYVSAGGDQVQDVSDTTTALQCSDGTAVVDHVGLHEIALAAGGALSATTTEETLFRGKAATATTVFRGHFHGTDANGDARAAGTWRRTITYDGAAKSCTSNPRPWSVTLAPQGSQAVVAPTAGSYAGTGISLFLSAAGTQVQDVVVPTTLRCRIDPPSDTRTEHLGIDEVAIGLDGSFSATTTRQGYFEQAAATFTYVFKGHTHGTDAAGRPRLAGTWRQTIAYNGSGGAGTCTSGDQPWSAVREAQPTQTTAAPPDGAYTGSNGQGDVLTFNVGASGTALDTISTPAKIVCPDAAGDFAFSVDTVPIQPDGSFSATVVPAGNPGDPITTYAFKGHVHGTGNDGKTRIAGTWRLDIDFNDGSGIACSSNDQAFSATSP